MAYIAHVVLDNVFHYNPDQLLSVGLSGWLLRIVSDPSRTELSVPTRTSLFSVGIPPG